MSVPEFADKVALITGAAGGIGGAVARRLHAGGARLILTDIDPDALGRIVAELPGSLGVEADASTAAGADAVIAAAGERVDILVNNAGTSDGGAALDEIDDATWHHVLDVNLNSAFLFSRRVIPGMLARGGGVILNMASVAGLRGGRTGIAYTASKWAMVGMVQNIAAFLGAEGIRAYALCPAAVTGAVHLGQTPPSPRAVRNRTRDAARPASTTPDDVAELAAFLASDRARHINGVAVPIDSGWTAF